RNRHLACRSRGRHRKLASGLGEPQYRFLSEALFKTIQFEWSELVAVGGPETPNQCQQRLDQSPGYQHVALALSGQGTDGCRDLRARLRKQQSLKSHAQAPVLDKGRQ